MSIVPDDKDWTWVLERRCPECGFDAATVALDDVPRLVRELVESWQVVLRQGAVDRRPSPTTWSPLEYGCHVRDVFTVFDERLLLMMDHDGASFSNWDKDATAVAHDYGSQDPELVAAELAQAGEILAEHFETVQPAQWSHTGIRSNGSHFTVATLAVYLVHDPIHHLVDVA